ncbi:MAG TPA: cupredoxin domain-containing protein [Pseudacidobacterium sp.]|nr:cupredoxin domain-containing protein [Pseudacidobacterium sp.]
MSYFRRTIFAALFIIFVFAVHASHAQATRTITIHAKRYKFMPEEITLTKGEQVKLILISDDVAHGLAVKGLGLRADMPKHKQVEVTVTPDQAGDFPGTCSRFCGAGHGSMKFLVHVVDKQ